MGPGSPPIVLDLAGTFIAPSATHVRINGFEIPFTFVGSSLLQCTVASNFPGVQAPGGFAVTVTTNLNRPGARSLSSNAIGVTIGTAISPDNAGTVSLAPRAPDPGMLFKVRVEAPVENVPVTLVVDLQQTFLVPFRPGGGFDVLLGTLFGQPIPLADGIGLFGPSTGATLQPNDLAPEGVVGPRGVFDLHGLVAPPQLLGVTFNVQAFYVDGSKPGGLNVTHVNQQIL
jgi:hypothetical protein